MRLQRYGVVVLCGFILASAAWARKPGDPIKPGRNLFSTYHDIQIGEAAALQVRQRYPVVQDPFLQEYIRRIGERLAATPEARRSGFLYSFTLLNVPQVNAFALPGGPMFVFTGIMNAAENEAQLAGVMAHEMSHVILRHGTHEASKAVGVQLVTTLLGAAAAAKGAAAEQLARLGLGFGANSFILHFSREAESEADLLGSHLLAEAGYNPIEMARFFEKLAAAGNQGLQFFSDHPNPDNRERAIETEIRALPQRDYGYQAGDFARARSEALLILAGGERGRGSTVPVPLPAAPAVSLQQLQSARFVLAFPSNWTANEDAQLSQWTIAPKDGLVPRSNGSPQLGYGAIAGYFSPTVGRDDIGTATLELVGYLHDDRPKLQLSATPQQRVRVDGAEALLTALANQSPYGAPEADILLTVVRPEGLFYLLCAAPRSTFPQLQSVFQQIVNSIRFSR